MLLLFPNHIVLNFEKNHFKSTHFLKIFHVVLFLTDCCVICQSTMRKESENHTDTYTHICPVHLVRANTIYIRENTPRGLVEVCITATSVFRGSGPC